MRRSYFSKKEAPAQLVRSGLLALIQDEETSEREGENIPAAKVKESRAVVKW